jgi:hypothetical protein
MHDDSTCAETETGPLMIPLHESSAAHATSNLHPLKTLPHFLFMEQVTVGARLSFTVTIKVQELSKSVKGSLTEKVMGVLPTGKMEPLCVWGPVSSSGVKDTPHSLTAKGAA